MVKLFFIGIGVFVLVVVGAFAAVFTPLLRGVDSNLGGSPKSPFHSPIPQPWVDTFHGWLGQATPTVWLYAVLGLLALLLVYMVGGLVAYLVRQWKARSARHAELRWQAKVTAAREQEAASVEAKAEYQAVWE